MSENKRAGAINTSDNPVKGVDTFGTRVAKVGSIEVPWPNKELVNGIWLSNNNGIKGRTNIKSNSA